MSASGIRDLIPLAHVARRLSLLNAAHALAHQAQRIGYDPRELLRYGAMYDDHVLVVRGKSCFLTRRETLPRLKLKTRKLFAKSYDTKGDDTVIKVLGNYRGQPSCFRHS